MAFSLKINGNQYRIMLQNERQLAQLVIEGIKILLENFLNQIWPTNNANPTFIPIMLAFLQMIQGLWNLTHFLNPFPNMLDVDQTPFSPPPLN